MADDNRSPGERLRVAVHESGHGLMAHALGRPVEVLSIRQGEHIGGVAIFGGDSDTGVPDLRRFESSMGPARPFEFRRRVEHGIAISLAGHAAEVSWVFPDEDGFDPTDPDVVLATQAAAELVSQPLISAYRADLLAKAERESRTRDEDTARLWAADLTPRAESFLCWMRDEVRCEVRTDLFQQRLRALAPALLAAEVLPGETVVEIIQRADRGFPVEIAASTR